MYVVAGLYTGFFFWVCRPNLVFGGNLVNLARKFVLGSMCGPGTTLLVLARLCVRAHARNSFDALTTARECVCAAPPYSPVQDCLTKIHCS